MVILAALAAAWVTVLVAAPWLPVPIAGVVYLFGAHICHQIAERSFHLEGVQLPVCARCFGIYAGAALLLVLPGPRRMARGARSGPAVSWVLGALVLNVATIAIEWAGLWRVSNAARAAAGAALGVAVAFAIRQVLGGGTVDYERCPSPPPITSALPPSRI